jgi:hypothetical protein
VARLCDGPVADRGHQPIGERRAGNRGLIAASPLGNLEEVRSCRCSCILIAKRRCRSAIVEYLDLDALLDRHSRPNRAIPRPNDPGKKALPRYYPDDICDLETEHSRRGGTMKNEQRRAALAAYKERKTAAGIYAIRCTTGDLQWAGAANDLSNIQNRLWFGLRLGTSPHRGLQAAWHAHGGGEGFTFEEVERLDEELEPYLRDRLLKQRLAHWCAALGAEPIRGA